MAWGAEPRDRERSPGRGPEDPGRLAAASAAQRQGSAHPRIIWEFHWRISGSPQPGNRRKGLHRLGVSLLNGLVSRGPRPGHSQPSYVKFTRLGQGDSDTREIWGQSE
jgi:hypothetical protein